jgi:hypothetical protein
MDELGALRRNQAGEAARLVVYVGTVAGLILLALGLALPRLLVISLPGFIVYLGLLQKIRGRRVWLDPYGVWIAALLVNLAWAALFLAEPRATAFHLFVIPAALFSVAAAGVGLYREVQRHRGR